ncbi:TY-Chap2 family putative peptide chaperone [Gimesia maris]|uniref:T3SS peptide-binding chaperone domain-containing protein n=1 Tax=Gimesia maris TaxID=122 RepID=A0ABX5YNP6_9PLAN|nr:hypothetical protein [Gimesia maris]EDL62301.1 hypothetical protein PM8797T_28274 [Gimesia maris DSM 8797]QEG17301.1 hypothetical protein GmarT_31810 [Gimesia maris]QGQ29602.1 hypothetical protein F1729_13605 [Gimesia maris]
MNSGRQLQEILSWRLITEFWRRFPDRFFLIETHPGGGQYDCLSLIELEAGFSSALSINREGSLHLSYGCTPGVWPDWSERMAVDPGVFLDELCQSIGDDVPQKLPPSTPSTIAFRFICEFLTHATGRLDNWECRNGFLDSSGFGCGRQDAWFNCFPTLKNSDYLKRLVKGELDPAYRYWFLLKDMMPQLCIDIGGKLYTRGGDTHDLAAIYFQHKKVWPVIAETAIQLLP